ncbi:MAG: extracellular solute-binding protein [Clostridiales bacterium]|nr:extracellular solute-binding protein [Clostridiales bacterium]
MKKTGKKLVSTLCAIAVCCSVCGAAVGCGNPFVEEEEQADTTKVQLYVGNFNQGFGKKWLEDAAARFCELKKDETGYAEGKTGVQIIIDDVSIGDSLIGSVGNERSEIIFNESMDYYSWIKRGNVRDITEIVTGDLGDFGEADNTIYDKMYPSAQSFYRYTDDKFYGIPFYESTFGIIYDRDVFENNNLYMDKNGRFTLSSQTDSNASSGPDGDAATTIDNGLPATFSEFYALCDEMKRKGLQPFTWTGRNDNYISRFIQSMSMYLDGYENSRIHFDLQGTATKLVDRIENGVAILKEPTEISQSDAYKMYESAGKYYTLEFLNNILSRNYDYSAKRGNTAYNHTNAQDDFVTNNTKRHKNSLGKDIAMLIDGTWFLNEAAGTFTDLSKTEPNASASIRQFGLMPLPHPDDWGPQKFTYVDTNQTLCCVTKNADESKMKLISDFIKFLHTDAELEAFTKSTSTLRAFKYIDGMDTSGDGFTPYAKQLIELKKFIGSDVIYPISDNAVFANNTNKLFFSHEEFLSSAVGASTLKYPNRVMVGSTPTSEKTYFDGLKAYHNATWWNGIIE